MTGDPVQKAAPRALYYLAIDGTSAIDSVAYGELLEGSKHGWRNLLGDFLLPAAGDADRLHDPAHPYLPIHLFKANTASKTVAVVCPGGREGFGKDPFWKAYAGETAVEAPNGKYTWPDTTYTTFGRHTAFIRSVQFAGELFRDPAVEVVTKNGQELRRLVDNRELPDTRERGTILRADLLIVSSHGWLGGYMTGNNINDWKDAEPAEAQPSTNGGNYYLVGKAAKEAHGFYGPRWIILAQCSTVNQATFALWTKVMGESVPAVRGILAYEEVSPAAAGSIPIARAFIKNCESMSIVDAWKSANQGQKWSAIVHNDAVNDRIAGWRDFAEPKSAATTADQSSYRGFLRSLAPAGEPIYDRPAPFELRLESAYPAASELTDAALEWDRIGPEYLDRPRARLVGNRWYRLGLIAPGEGKIVSATVTWIHIRPTYAKQFAVAKLFQVVQPLIGHEDVEVGIDTANKKVIAAKARGTPGFTIAFALRAVSDALLAQSGMEAHHSYLWPRITIVLADGKELRYDFMTTGLSYVG